MYHLQRTSPETGEGPCVFTKFAVTASAFARLPGASNASQSLSEASAALGPALESAKAQLSEAAAELGPALEALKAQAQKAADDAAAQIEALKSPSPAPSSTDE